MAPPGNGIFVVRGEISTLMTAMKRGNVRWSAISYHEEDQDGLLKSFHELKSALNQVEDLRLIDPNIFLGPFLEVIRSEETTGPVTSLALSAINKFLSYGLIDPTYSALAATVENIADAVTHARFVGTDQASDGVVLMKIIQVLRTLIMNPEGSVLTNESVCEIMLSCFRICFEPRLNELLRRTAEHALKDMVLLLFMRLPQFAEDRQQFHIKKLKMRAGAMDQTTKKRKIKTVNNTTTSTAPIKPTTTTNNNNNKPTIPRVTIIKTEENGKEISPEEIQSPNLNVQQLKAPPLATTPATPCGNIVDMQGSISQTPTSSTSINQIQEDVTIKTDIIIPKEEEEEIEIEKPLLLQEDSIENDADFEDDGDNGEPRNVRSEEYVNSMGVRFTQQTGNTVTPTPLYPYGLPCIRELFRFLISLCNPMDKQNTDAMMHMGLSLLTVALEIGADSIGKYDTLLSLVKDEMCRNLFSLLNTERLTIFASDLQVCFLLFESLRSHLKFQLEYYLTQISDIIGNESLRPQYETRELALDNLLQLWRIPGFTAEIYINYDCDLYCTNLFEDITKLLSKNTLSATQMLYSIHNLSMDALLTVVDRIEKNCQMTKNISNGSVKEIESFSRHSRNNSNTDNIIIDNDNVTSGGESVIVENINSFIERNNTLNERSYEIITQEQLINIKNKKRLLSQGTELFNTRPEKGIQFLQENGIFNTILDPMEIAQFLRENPGLDKKMIGEYISKKKNVEIKILETFVKSFEFVNMRVDQALRLYLETFRLPGEAPLIFLVMEHFSDHWHKCNNEPFANTDAAFRLAYAIIMLNMDQHNHNAKRLNIPMTAEDFQKNLRGLNGNMDFDQEMLLEVFNAIKNEEIVMPAEQTGLVRENYLWKVLLRRDTIKDCTSFQHVFGPRHDKDLFEIIWGSTLTALSFMFDKTIEPILYQQLLNGFEKCAFISSYYNLYEDFDAIILTLCKFSTLLQIPIDYNEIQLSVNFGQNLKAQLSMKTVFNMVHEHGDCMRESWKTILDVINQLFRLKLLPKNLIEVEDFCEPTGKILLINEKQQLAKSDAGLFSSLYSYLSSDSQRLPSYEEQEIIKITKRCIKDCQIEQLIIESKFLQYESLQELIKFLLNLMKPPEFSKTINGGGGSVYYAEDSIVFIMELLVKILIQNRDRILPLWQICHEQIYLLLIGSATYDYEYLLTRTTIGILKLAIYLMRNEELCPIILKSLNILLMLKTNIILRISKQISIGMYELLKTSAQNIHTEMDWSIVFIILECVGAGAVPPDFDEIITGDSNNGIINNHNNIGGVQNVTKSDGAVSSEEDSGLPDRGYISDSEIGIIKSGHASIANSPVLSPSGENWILINKETEKSLPSSSDTLAYSCKLLEHSPFALVKCWDCLAFIVRNVAHITPYNFESCVKCIRTFVEATLNGGGDNKRRRNNRRNSLKYQQNQQLNQYQQQLQQQQQYNSKKKKNKNDASSDSDSDDLPDRYQTIAIQLLDLMHTLHTRTAQIFRWWAEESGALPQCSALWEQGWCPILQGISRLATDKRRQVRTSAITCLQRSLLVHDLQTLSGPEWSSCFKQVLFPLLDELLLPTNNIEQTLVEESRMRSATIMAKVFLHHLTPLITLNDFNVLWLEILEYLERFMKVGSDMLYEAVLESLKNMLLVMHSVRIFHQSDGQAHSDLWDLTWTRIKVFLPNLKDELFATEESTTTIITDDINKQQSRSLINQSISTTITGGGTIQSFGISPSVSTISQMDSITPIPKSSIILQPPIERQSTGSPMLVGSPPPPPLQSIPILLPQSVLISSPIKTFSPPPPPQTPQPPQTLQTIINTENNSLPIQQHQSQSLYTQPPQVPISHLMAVNQYPSLSHVPENIAKSFTPIFVQPQIQSGSDIFNDYVNNPYNLTLIDGLEAAGRVVNVENTNDNLEKIDSNISNVFQSANYFGADTGKEIPPGSEMLFGGS